MDHPGLLVLFPRLDVDPTFRIRRELGIDRYIINSAQRRELLPSVVIKAIAIAHNPQLIT